MTNLELRKKARTLYPTSRRLAAKWVLAAVQLQRTRGGFINEKHVRKPDWSYAGERG